VCTPHSAHFSDQSIVEMRQIAARELRSGLVGQIPNSLRHCINREIFVSSG
jgi:C-terminal binding protein